MSLFPTKISLIFFYFCLLNDSQYLILFVLLRLLSYVDFVLLIGESFTKGRKERKGGCKQGAEGEKFGVEHLGKYTRQVLFLKYTTRYDPKLIILRVCVCVFRFTEKCVL